MYGLRETAIRDRKGRVLFAAIARATRDVDLGRSVDVGPAARASRNFGVSLLVDDLVLLCPLAARVRAAAHEDTITESRIDFLPLLHLIVRVK